MTGQTYAGAYRAADFPAGIEWLNTGRPLTLEELRGKIVILDFWTYGCINCMHVIPDLKKLEEEYGRELVVIGVHSAKFANEGKLENLRKIILRYGIRHPVVNDREFKVWNKWAVKAWPTLIIIDPSGMVSGYHSGEGVYQVFKPVIESLIAGFGERGLINRSPLNFLPEEGEADSGLLFPGKVLADEQGDRLFISDSGHNRLLISSLKTGQVIGEIGCGKAGFKDGSFKEAALHNPQGMALSSDGQTLYLADTDNHAIRIIDLGKHSVATLAGDGMQTQSHPIRDAKIPAVELNSPWDVELIGGELYIAMAGAHQLCKIRLKEGYLVPFAGSGREGVADGPLHSSELAQPSGLAYDGSNRLYFADAEGSSIRWADIGTSQPEVHTLAGSGLSLFDFGDRDGKGNRARFQHALGISFYKGMIYVADTYNHKIKSIDPETGEVTTLAGSARDICDLSGACFYEPGGLSAAGDKLYIADTNDHIVRAFDLVTHKAVVIQI